MKNRNNKEAPVELAFASSQDFRVWLSRNHDKSQGIWLLISKKESEVDSITYAEALDQSLCYGWIDGQKKKRDDKSWLQRFTPRRSGSSWSKKNTEHAERLIKSGEMTPSGLKRINEAKEDGRWKSAYDAFGSAAAPEDFLKELAKNKKAHAFFKTLTKTNLYSIGIVFRLPRSPRRGKTYGGNYQNARTGRDLPLTIRSKVAPTASQSMFPVRLFQLLQNSSDGG